MRKASSHTKDIIRASSYGISNITFLSDGQQDPRETEDSETVQQVVAIFLSVEKQRIEKRRRENIQAKVFGHSNR